ncbi:unnamed protein product [Calicophoron daubneyi]|uniref:Uncharacterized protein n=1 Tax=Calicophoron daubneyi TaxID=300641 RepID=A0AAV2TS35_CALDB
MLEVKGCQNIVRSDLSLQIENLRTKLDEAAATIARKDIEINEIQAKYGAEITHLEEELVRQRKIYDQLASSHQNLSKLNNQLEAKLLETIEQAAVDKKSLTEELEVMRTKLNDCERSLVLTKAERDQYKEDCCVAVNLLHANPDSFITRSASSAIQTNSVNDDCQKEHAQPSRFPAFLPTFPPVCPYSMFTLDTHVRVDEAMERTTGTAKTVPSERPSTGCFAEPPGEPKQSRPRGAILADL